MPLIPPLHLPSPQERIRRLQEWLLRARHRANVVFATLCAGEELLPLMVDEAMDRVPSFAWAVIKRLCTMLPTGLLETGTHRRSGPYIVERQSAIERRQSKPGFVQRIPLDHLSGLGRLLPDYLIGRGPLYDYRMPADAIDIDVGTSSARLLSMCHRPRSR